MEFNNYKDKDFLHHANTRKEYIIFLDTAIKAYRKLKNVVYIEDQKDFDNFLEETYYKN